MDPTQAPPDASTPAPPTEPPPVPPPLPAAAPAPVRRAWALYGLIPAVAALAADLQPHDPTLAIVASGLVLGVCWLGFFLLNPVAVGLEVLALIIAGHWATSPVAASWLGAAALGGFVGARMTQRNAHEDDFVFLPWLAILALFFLLLACGGLRSVEQAADLALATAHLARQELELLIKQAQSSGRFKDLFRPEDLAHIRPYFEQAMLSVFFGFWALGLWLFGRLARRLLQRLRGYRPSLLMFRIHQRYIFLLILGLILEIFSILSKREALSYLAWPILTVLAIACIIEGLGVVLFILAVRRAAAGHSPRRGGWGLGMLTLLLLFAFVEPVILVLAVLGLVDVWADFRRLDRFGQQLGL